MLPTDSHSTSQRTAALIGIARRAEKRAAMETLPESWITQQSGVQGDSRGKPSRRQVTVLSKQAWETACAEVSNETQPWTIRRANLLIDGFDFSEQDVGKKITIGELVLEVMIETDPCFRMDEQLDGLQVALKPDWRGGVCCKVINDGFVRLGDAVEIN